MVEPAKSSTWPRTVAALLALVGVLAIALTVVGLLGALARDDEVDRLSTGDLLLRASGFFVLGLVCLGAGLWWRRRHPGERLLAVPHTLDELSAAWGFEPDFLTACATLEGFPPPLPDGRYDEADVSLFVEERGADGARSTPEARWMRALGVLAVVALVALALTLLNLALQLVPSVTSGAAIVSLATLLFAAWGYVTAIGGVRRVRFRVGATELETQLDQPAWIDRRVAEVADARERWWARYKRAQIVTAVLFVALLGTAFLPDDGNGTVILPLALVTVVLVVVSVRTRASKSDFDRAVRDAEPDAPR
jgi:hypothetical protein